VSYKIGLFVRREAAGALRNLADRLKPMFGGEVFLLVVDVDADAAERILSTFPSARVDARGFIEDLPVAFRRTLLKAIMETGNVGRAAFERVFAEIERIKGEAAREGSLFRRQMFEWFVLGLFIGVMAPMAGVGGAVLFTPLALVFTGLVGRWRLC